MIKKIYHTNNNRGKAGVAIVIAEKLDFKTKMLVELMRDVS